MKKHLLTALFISMVLPIIAQDEVSFKSYWKNGMRIESSDGNFKFKFGGRIQVDWATFNESQGIKQTIGSSANGTEFRRARFYNSGLLYGNIKYKLQLDFAEGIPEFKDAYIMITDIPLAGFIQIGHFKEPFGFDELTSSKHITFMERSLLSEDEPSRNTGIMIGNSLKNERLSFRLGVFKDTDDFGKSTDENDKYNITSRLYGLPIHKPGQNRIMHLGLSYSHRSPKGNEYELTIAPESNMANDYLTTAFSDASQRRLIQSEALYINGSFALESEMIFGKVNRTNSGSSDFKSVGYYSTVSWFLTGESKQYSTDGELDRITPNRNYNGQGEWGAWEVALRYSSIDLGDYGNKLSNVTLGLNWYLNPVTRFMFNYIYSDVENIGHAHITQMRFQIDF